MLIACIILYLLTSIAIGLWAGRRVHSSKDYTVAGRSLPLYMVIATVFATWFGSETVLGTSSTFITDGALGIIADPFGAALCLIFVGLFFAVKLYRLNLNTIADYYRIRYDHKVEMATSVIIMLSYLGWVAAQLAALGLVFNVVTHGAISVQTGTLIGAGVVLLYTLYGGMWSVALTDLFQMTLIVIGLIIITFSISHQVAGGASHVIVHAYESGKLRVIPELTWTGVLGFIGAVVTLGLGSIPQQDIFQRVTSARTENIARNGAVIGGVLYFVFAMLPIFLGYSAFLIAPDMVQHALSPDGDSQLVLPTLILEHTPIFIQVLFVGALLAAIMSTASGTILAPSSVFVSNILKPVLVRHARKDLSDEKTLFVVRATVFVFTILVTIYTLIRSDEGIFNMVENAYKITLVGAFVPLAFGMYWRRANAVGAHYSIALGILGLIVFEVLDATHGQMTGWQLIGLPSMAGVCPSQLFGLILAIVGMVFGSLFSTPNTSNSNG